MSFYIIGSSEEDSLLVESDIHEGRLLLSLPISALPWRDLEMIEKHGRRRSPYGCGNDDPLATVEAHLEGDEVTARTDIEGASTLDLANGIATIGAPSSVQIFVPCLRVASAARMPASVAVAGREVGVVRVTQLSGGARIGGTTLVVREPKGYPANAAPDHDRIARGQPERRGRGVATDDAQ
ncbi:Hypothetical protein A7982_04430 [Minicystis rosea]|nr:Hypothetical protein A7982_04430 [Minicystis rosea]